MFSREFHTRALQVGEVRAPNPEKGPPGDFECYRRAESMPTGPNCPKSARGTLIADSKNPAADHAAETSAALIASAALLVPVRTAVPLHLFLSVDAQLL